MSYIEVVFLEKTSEELNKESYKALVAYWKQIQLHIPKILSCVSQVFPHYTLHDVSHSEEILNSITRILGFDTVKNLSCTDLWMILCAAYCHDVGMFIDGDEIENLFDSNEFIQFVETLTETSKLYKYAQCFKLNEKRKLVYDNTQLTLISYNAARFLLADFIRKKHAERSKEILTNALGSVDWDIKRLYDLVVDEGLMHGSSFTDVMQQPRFEKGMGDDVCHPRFISCLIRLGDLLDFDSTRISRYLVNHLSKSLPDDSKTHLDKHASIKHIDISTERISATAECESCDAASEVSTWFSWIKEELYNQRNSWYEIVPKNYNQSLPMFNDVEIHMKNGFDKIDDKYKSKFDIDAASSLKLLQGSSVYSDRSCCFREILQNSVDATYIRIFSENESGIDLKNAQKGFSQFVKFCKNIKYCINISLKKENGKWHFSIADNGIGMSKSDLRYILEVGSSKNNKEKKSIVNRMPEYAKPSGIFGIGFQSVFLLTDEVHLTTRRFDDGLYIDSRLRSPLKDGFVIMKTENKRFANFGTKIEFDLEEGKLPELSQFSRTGEELKKTFDEFDFVEKSDEDLKVAVYFDAITDFAWNCRIPIKLNGKKANQNNDKTALFVDNNNKYYVELRLLKDFDARKNADLRFANKNLIRFRDTRVKNAQYLDEIKFYHFDINILSGNADEVLLLNRETMVSSFQKKIRPFIITSAVDYLIKEGFRYLDNEGYKILASMFLNYYGKLEDSKPWENKILYSNGLKEITIKNILEKKYTVNIRSSVSVNQTEVSKNKIVFYELGDPVIDFLAYVLREKNYSIYFTSYVNPAFGKKMIEFQFSTKGKDRVDWISWFEWFKNKKQRSLMPCFGYEKLVIKNAAFAYASHDPMSVFEKIDYPRTVCPWLTVDGKIEWVTSDKFYNWIYENRDDEKVSLDEIKKEFDKLKKDLSPIIKKIK